MPAANNWICTQGKPQAIAGFEIRAEQFGLVNFEQSVAIYGLSIGKQKKYAGPHFPP